MSVRAVEYEFEAKVESNVGGPCSKHSGKLERKTYDNFGERSYIPLRKLRVSDNSMAMVAADSLEIAQIPAEDGPCRVDNELRDPTTFPKLEAGEDIEVRVNATLVLSGVPCMDCSNLLPTQWSRSVMVI